MPLLEAISAESLVRVSDLAWLRSSSTESGSSTESVQKFAQFILAVAWSLSFTNLMTIRAFACFDKALRQIGAEMDLRASLKGAPRRQRNSMEEIRTRSGIEPSLPVVLRGMVTIYKPSDWEVDGLSTEEGQHPPLSAYMHSIFLEDEFPLVWDADNSYGFLHRLDIPSSGLILGGTSYEGYYCLRLQLDTQRLCREYVVLCQGLALSALRSVVARIDVAPDPSQRKSISESGKPSETMLCINAHIRGIAAVEEGRMCIVSVRIATGRRHQIRAHMRYVGHPSVADARYTCREVLLLRRPQAMEEGDGESAMQPFIRGGAEADAQRRRWTYNLAGDGRT